MYSRVCGRLSMVLDSGMPFLKVAVGIIWVKRAVQRAGSSPKEIRNPVSGRKDLKVCSALTCGV